VGSPITFSGFNQIDFNVILNAVMAQEREPLTRLEAQKKALDTQKSAFGTLAGKLADLEAASDALREADSLAALTATSSDDAVGVATTSGTLSGTYDVVVTATARSQVLSSENTFASLDTEVATAGTFTIDGVGGDSVTITITASTTLQELADAINAESDSPARASVVRTGADAYRLVLTATDTGVDGGFTVTNGLTGTLAYTDTDFDGVSGDSAADNTRTAQDAAFTVNGVAVTSALNTVDGVIPGVTLTLKSADPATTVVIGVTRDSEAAAARLEKFITAYNGLQTFMKAQEADATGGKPSIGRDPLLRSFRSGIRQALQAAYDGSVTRLAAAGVGVDISGTLKLDRDAFDEVFAASSADLQSLFSGDDGESGVFGAITTLIEDYTEAGGLVADARERLTDQIKAIGGRMDDLEARLAVRRATLQREYIAADLAMSQLNSQSGSLASLGGDFRLF
jgi:flagellar hook-associated protein 2